MHALLEHEFQVNKMALPLPCANLIHALLAHELQVGDMALPVSCANLN